MSALFIILFGLSSISLVPTQASAQQPLAPRNHSLTQQAFSPVQALYNEQSTPQEIKDRFRQCGNVRVMNASHLTIHDIVAEQARIDFTSCARWDTSTEIDVVVAPMVAKSYSLDRVGFLKMTYQVRASTMACQETPAYVNYEVIIESLLATDFASIRCDYKSIQ